MIAAVSPLIVSLELSQLRAAGRIGSAVNHRTVPTIAGRNSLVSRAAVQWWWLPARLGLAPTADVTHVPQSDQTESDCRPASLCSDGNRYQLIFHKKVMSLNENLNRNYCRLRPVSTLGRPMLSPSLLRPSQTFRGVARVSPYPASTIRSLPVQSNSRARSNGVKVDTAIEKKSVLS